jgi:hypothetical protein
VNTAAKMPLSAKRFMLGQSRQLRDWSRAWCRLSICRNLRPLAVVITAVRLDEHGISGFDLLKCDCRSH